ncbi:MAG: FtsX-like permease family protein [Rickettsiales bacterium]|nr:FtsX-like permease family protein [Rickettsiales bacterium]
MYVIALKMLFGDRGKYIAMVVGVMFASLIMTQQPSIMVGLLSRTYAFVDNVSLPDIWVMDPGVQYVEEHKPIRDVDMGRVRGVEGVEWTAPLFKNFLRAKLPDGATKTIDMTGLDDATLIGAPKDMLEGSLNNLRRTDAVLVNKESAEKQLRVKNPDGTDRALAVGDVIEINDKRAVVVGYMKTLRNFVLQPQVFTTYTRATAFSPPDRRKLTYILVKAKDGVDHKELAKKISAYTGLMALTSDEFRDFNLGYWMKNTGIPINFGISVMLGFIVGAAIVSQTFFTFVNQNMKHYAALKSMGVHDHMLTRMVLLQAAAVGFTGYGLGVGLTTIFGLNVLDSVLAFRMPPILLLFAAIGVFLMLMITAFFAIRKILRIDPAIVFRG